AKKKTLDPSYRYWLILCFVFLFLSIDEAAMIHEKIGHVTNRLLPHTLPSAWAIPYAFLAGILGVILVRLLLSLTTTYRILFCLSGALYVGGALDRKSTRLNSSHVKISYAVFCLKKKMLVS